jgi:hypothetical protein
MHVLPQQARRLAPDPLRSNGYVVKRVTENADDWLYILRPDGSEYLVKSACLAAER